MKKQYVLVTGGSRGIGAGIARRLKADGYKPIILDQVKPDDGMEAEFYRVDLHDRQATIRVLEEVSGKYPITRLVNNVGIVRPAPLENTTPEDFEEVMMLNAWTAIFCARFLLPVMRDSKFGRIVSITSRAILGKELRTAYSASKGAIASMSRTWALELARDGITVNTVAPGPIETKAFRKNNPPDDQSTRTMIDRVPVGRLGKPADVANAVSFFLDERSGFITGQTLYVCGGLTAGSYCD